MKSTRTLLKAGMPSRKVAHKNLGVSVPTR
jgi:hypothetical protein